MTTWARRPSLWNRLARRVGARGQRLLSKAMTPERSLEVAQRVLVQAVQKHGPDARFTVNAMWEVAQRLDDNGQPGEALILRQQIVDRMRAHLGEDDLETLSAEHRLAASLMKNRRAREAQPLLEHVVASRTRLLGYDHPQTSSAIQWLDRARQQAGDR